MADPLEEIAALLARAQKLLDEVRHDANQWTIEVERLPDVVGNARRRDPVWDTLVEILGAAPEGLERGRWNAACKSLRASGATPDSIHRAAAEYRRHPSYAQCVMTPTALAANWTVLTATPKSDAELQAARERERWDRVDAEQKERYGR